MANLLENITRDNSRYTIFENNQVLTADQLNDLHNYLHIQEKATRARVVGVGIVGGLELGQLDSGNLVVGKGVALTTDGDLAWFDNDIEFDSWLPFEDVDALYKPYRDANNKVLPLFELVAVNNRRDGKKFSEFARATNTELKEYSGILYLEEYIIDPDMCTGADCDNRGKEVIRNWRFLIINNKNIRQLLSSLPKLNSAFFKLEDVKLNRIIVNPAVDTFTELQKNIDAALSAKDVLKNNLTNLWNLAGFIADDIITNDNIAIEWAKLLDDQFATTRKTIYIQYLYDYLRDLIDAYQEMKDLLFNDSTILCPDVNMFPKHVLLGRISVAAPKLQRLTTGSTGITAASNRLAGFKFNLDLSVRRFTHIQLEDQFRHRFYESPILNNTDEKIQQIRFGFARIDAMIQSFAVPDVSQLDANNIRITPGLFLDKPLGKRAIPYYFGFGKSSKNVPAYWSYENNIRRSENLQRAYFAPTYTNHPYATQPFNFDLSECDFYRIEGHIGLTFDVAERKLNALITQNNLPINIECVQVEKNVRTVPDKNWWFKDLNYYELIQRRSMLDQLHQVDLANSAILQMVPERQTELTPAVNAYRNTKNTFTAKYGTASRVANTTAYSADLAAVAQQASDIKVQTKQHAYSNTAAPHDFVINTNSAHKLDLINDFINQRTEAKKTDLLLGNYLAKNPGLEHAAGVLRGGTFVLVYSSNDNKVIADFYLPYANVDQDIAVAPPTVKPLPLIPRYEIPRLFEKTPQVELNLGRRFVDVDDKFKLFDRDLVSKLDLVKNDLTSRISLTDNNARTVFASWDSRFRGVNDNINERVDTNVGSKLEGITKDFQTRITSSLAQEQNTFYTRFLSTIKLDTTKGLATTTPGRFMVAEVDLTPQVTKMRSLTAELEANPNMEVNLRATKEKELGLMARQVNETITKVPAANIDSETTDLLKALQFDFNKANTLITRDAEARTHLVTGNRNFLERIKFK